MENKYRMEIGYSPKTMVEIYQSLEGLYRGSVFEEIGRELSLKLRRDKPGKYPSKQRLEESLIRLLN